MGHRNYCCLSRELTSFDMVVKFAGMESIDPEPTVGGVPGDLFRRHSKPFDIEQPNLAFYPAIETGMFSRLVRRHRDWRRLISTVAN